MSNKFIEDADIIFTRWFMGDSFDKSPEVSYRVLKDLIIEALSNSYDTGFADRGKLLKMQGKLKVGKKK